jgi:hypothetical protein
MTMDLTTVYSLFACLFFGFAGGWLLAGFRTPRSPSGERTQGGSKDVSCNLKLPVAEGCDHGPADEDKRDEPDYEAVIRRFVESLCTEPFKLNSRQALTLACVSLCLCALVHIGADDARRDL